MAEETHVGAGLPDLLKRLNNLVTEDMIGDFEKLKKYGLNAGPRGMDAAQWLEDVVKDRRDGLIAHAKLLRATFVSLADAIGQAARHMTGTDSDGVGGLEAIEAWLSSSDPDLLPLVTHSYVDGRSTYDSGDTGSEPKLFFDVNDSGERVTKDGRVVIDLPNKTDTPPDLYQEIINDIPDRPGSRTDRNPPDYFFLEEYVVK